MVNLPPSFIVGPRAIHAAARSHGAWLEVDLQAIAENWKHLARLAGQAAVGAAVKADAYGLGAAPVGEALWQAGCRHFFVAHLAEGAALRAALPYALIYVLHGAPEGFEADCLDYGLIPVLNNPHQLSAWVGLARRMNRGPLPAVLHIDTGMTRLGFAPRDIQKAAKDRELMAHLDLRYVMSHLSCGDERGHPKNEEQRKAFHKLRRLFPKAEASLANSGGLFQGRPYHYDLARPGIALYGGAPLMGEANPMRPVVRLCAQILETRDITEPTTVGYSGTYKLKKGRIAILPVGYADGLMRALSNKGFALVQGVECPYAGRVSMDLVAIDVSRLPEGAGGRGEVATVIGDGITIDRLAEWAGTNAYEIICRLGPRLTRLYTGPYANSNEEAPPAPSS